jgi:SAM-dependent methyltransferase
MNQPSSHAKLDRDWVAYYNAVEGRPPRDTLLAALAQFEAEPFEGIPRVAVDLGCGDGRDTVELLRRGWQVLGIDGEATAIARLLERSEANCERLQTQIARFESLTLPASVDLINASFCLPFCPPEHFPYLWNEIATSLRVGGRFCGQLFGDQDSWASDPLITYQTRAEIEQLLQPFAIEMLNEENHPGTTALGEEKHWHIFHIVVKKKAARNSN